MLLISLVASPSLPSFPCLLCFQAFCEPFLGYISLLWHCCGVIKGILMNKKIIFENKNISNRSTLYFHCSVFSCISCIILVCCHAGKILSTDLTLGNWKSPFTYVCRRLVLKKGLLWSITETLFVERMRGVNKTFECILPEVNTIYPSVTVWLTVRESWFLQLIQKPHIQQVVCTYLFCVILYQCLYKSC